MSDFFETRFRAAKGVVVAVKDDTPIMLRLRYIGGGTVTSVTVTTATSLVTIDSVGGTKTYLFATYTTLATLAAAINSDGFFQAVVLDALLTDATNASNIVENTAITAGTDDNGVVVWDLHADTSVNKSITAALSLHRNFDTNGKGHRVHLQEIVYNVDVSAAAANAVRVYHRTPAGVETQILGRASVDATTTTITWVSGNGKITAGDNCDLIIRVQDATSVTDATANLVQAAGLLE